MKWTPDPSIIPFIDIHEDEQWTAPVISISDETMLDTASSYSIEFVGNPLECLEVNADKNGVVLSVSQPGTNLFCQVDIEYQIPGGTISPYRITKHCSNFADLPGNLEEVIRYQPCPTNTQDFTVKIIANLSSGATSTAEYVIRVWANYSIGKMSLLEAINASCSKKG